MPDRSFLNWPFFEARHRELGGEAWKHGAQKNLPVDHHDVDAACRELVAMLGRDGWLKPTALDTAQSRAARRAHALHHARDAGAA